MQLFHQVHLDYVLPPILGNVQEPCQQDGPSAVQAARPDLFADASSLWFQASLHKH